MPRLRVRQSNADRPETMTGQLPANSDDGSDQRFHLLTICMPRYANIADPDFQAVTIHTARI